MPGKRGFGMHACIIMRSITINNCLYTCPSFPGLSSRDLVLTYFGTVRAAVTEKEDTWQHEWQPLCPLASVSQTFSLVSFPFTNLFLTLSLFLLVGLLKCRTAGRRQTGITGSVAIVGGATDDLYTVWSTG